jgi:hypothetical protein
MLVSAGLFVVLVPLNVPGFCPVLAYEWHGVLPVDLLSIAG